MNTKKNKNNFRDINPKDLIKKKAELFAETPPPVTTPPNSTTAMSIPNVSQFLNTKDSLPGGASVPSVVVFDRPPTTSDTRYKICTFWIDTSDSPSGIYLLSGMYNSNDMLTAHWIRFRETIATDVFLGTFFFQNTIGTIAKAIVNGAFKFIAGENISFSGTINSGEIMVSAINVGEVVKFQMPNGDEVKYTGTEKFIIFENGSDISIEKGAEENIIKISANNNIPLNEFVKTLQGDFGSTSTTDSIIRVFGADGLLTTGGATEFKVGINPLFSLVRKYEKNGTYVTGELVLYDGVSYVCVRDGVSTTDTPSTSIFFRNVPVFQIQDTVGTGTVSSNAGQLELETTDPNVLEIKAIGTDPKSTLSFDINAIQTLKDSSGALVIKDSDSCIKFTARTGTFEKRAGELYLNNPLPPGASGMDGLVDQYGVKTILDADFRNTLAGAPAVFNQNLTSDIETVTELDGNGDPTSKMLFRLINPLKLLVVGEKKAKPNSTAGIEFTSSDKSVDISIPPTDDNIIDFKATFNEAWIKYLQDDNGARAVPTIPGGDVQLTSQVGNDPNTRQISITKGTTANDQYKLIFRLLITWIQGLVSDDNEIVAPNNNRNIVVTGVPTDAVFITTSRDPNNPSILRLKVNGIPAINPSTNNTGVRGTITYNYNATTRTFTLNSGTFNFLQSNGTSVQYIVTTPLTYTNNTPGITYFYISSTGTLFASPNISRIDYRIACLLGEFAYDPAGVAPTYFQLQPITCQTPASSVDSQFGSGPTVLSSSGVGFGGLICSKQVVSTLVARMNTTGGSLEYLGIASAINQVSPNVLSVSGANTPAIIKFYYYQPQTNSFVLLSTQTDLILNQYAPVTNGIATVTTIPNNNYCYMNVYFVRSIDVNTPQASYWVCVLADRIATDSFTALQRAIEQQSLNPFILPNLLRQFVLYRAEIIWRKTQTDYTSLLYINNNDQNGNPSLSAGSSPGDTTIPTYNVTKKGVVLDVLSRVVLSNNNTTITITQGEVYINGFKYEQPLITFTPPSDATTRKYIISSDNTGTTHLDQLTVNFDFKTFYLTRAPLVVFWLNNVNNIHNISAYTPEKVELTTTVIDEMRLRSSLTSCVATVVQPTQASLLSVTVDKINASHVVFNDLFDPWTQGNIERYQYSQANTGLVPFPILPTDALWRASILLIANCQEKTPVVLKATEFGMGVVVDPKLLTIIDGKLCYLNEKRQIVARIDVDPRAFGRNTGFYYEVFLSTQGFNNAGDCKQNLTQLLNQYYSLFFESMSLKVCFYTGTLLVDVIDVHLDGRAIGSNRSFTTDDQLSTITF